MSQTVNRLTSAGYAVRARDPGDGRKVTGIVIRRIANDRVVEDRNAFEPSSPRSTRR